MQSPIRDWFTAHEDDDFVILPRSHPFSVIPPTNSTGTVIYSTKPCVLRLHEAQGDRPSFAAILRGGLPTGDDARWLASMVGSRRLLFLGDADPPDLLVFAWLRQRVDVSYLGVSDNLLARCAVPLDDKLTIALSDSEAAAWPLLSQCLGDAQAQIGEWCFELLRAGRKIELEALFSFASCTPAALAAALVA